MDNILCFRRKLKIAVNRHSIQNDPQGRESEEHAGHDAKFQNPVAEQTNPIFRSDSVETGSKRLAKRYKDREKLLSRLHIPRSAVTYC